ncbi:hypothetical protein IV71_GL001459 [Fructobacillus fructosus KCTC 3544]|nr:hypothetical protein IV71_GL001459 [Fructobacillus fructosus KCTC 3544]
MGDFQKSVRQKCRTLFVFKTAIFIYLSFIGKKVLHFI